MSYKSQVTCNPTFCQQNMLQQKKKKNNSNAINMKYKG
jgi:hypothetical protein